MLYWEYCFYKKNINLGNNFYLTTQLTHFIYGYMALYGVEDHSEREIPLLVLHGLLVSISSKGSFIPHMG